MNIGIEISFVLNEAQSKVVSEIMPLLTPEKKTKIKTESDLAKSVFIQWLIQTKQQVSAREIQDNLA